METKSAELHAILDKVEASLPDLGRRYPDEGDFMMAFAALTGPAEDRADAEQYPWVRERIEMLLARHAVSIHSRQHPSAVKSRRTRRV